MFGSHECKILSADMIEPYFDMMSEMLDMVPDSVIKTITDKFEEDPIYYTETMSRFVKSAPTTTYTF